MNTIFIITYSIWCLSEILISRLMVSKKTDKQNVDKGSLYLIWFFIFIGIFASVYTSIRYYLPILENPAISYFGILIIYLGLVLRLAIIKSLGQFFTVDVTIRENHTLKTDGFYKYLRHPSYSASLLSFIGFGISLNNVASLALVFILILTAFMQRIRVEEKVLIDQFGDEYLAYKKTSKAIIPFIY